MANDDSSEAEQKLQEAADLIRKELGDTHEREATAALVDVARALGLDFNPDEEGDD